MVSCKNNKLFPPGVASFVVFIVIRESDNPQVDIPENVVRTRLSQTLNATKQPNDTHNRTSSFPDNQIFPEVSYQEIEDLDISEFRVEADLLALTQLLKRPLTSTILVANITV